MIELLSRFFILFIVIYCVQMIYFIIREKSKKFNKRPTVAMIYIGKLIGFEGNLMDIKPIRKHISLINSAIFSIDLLIYLYMNSLILKLIIIFVITNALIYVSYALLAKYYRKLME